MSPAPESRQTADRPLRVEKEVEIPASPAAIFEALTDPAKIVRCFPLERAHCDGRVGGIMRLEGILDGEPFIDHGTIDVFDPPRELQYTYWSDNHGTERLPENHMTVRYRLESQGESTRLRVTHENLLSEERVATMEVAWDFLLQQLSDFCTRSRP